MNKKSAIGVGIAAIGIFVLALTNPNLRENKDTWFGFTDTSSELNPPVTQQDLQMMIDEWINNPDEDDRNQRLEIMKAYYTFEETGQKLTQEREGLLIMNQIRKMVSLDMPREELYQLRQEVREELKDSGFNLDSIP